MAVNTIACVYSNIPIIEVHEEEKIDKQKISKNKTSNKKIFPNFFQSKEKSSINKMGFIKKPKKLNTLNKKSSDDCNQILDNIP